MRLGIFLKTQEEYNKLLKLHPELPENGFAWYKERTCFNLPELVISDANDNNRPYVYFKHLKGIE